MYLPTCPTWLEVKSSIYGDNLLCFLCYCFIHHFLGIYAMLVIVVIFNSLLSYTLKTFSNQAENWMFVLFSLT